MLGRLKVSLSNYRLKPTVGGLEVPGGHVGRSPTAA